MAALRFPGTVDAEQERMRTRTNIKTLSKLKKIAPNRVEIRIIDYLFEYSAFFVNNKDSNGIIYIQRYTFKTMGASRKPKLVYTRSDGRWYDLFQSEILELWENATPLVILEN